MRIASVNGFPGGSCDLGWSATADVVAGAELTVAIVAPAPEGVIGFDGARVIGADGEGVPIGTRDLVGGLTVFVVSGAELAKVVRSRAPEGVIGFGGARVAVTGGDGIPTDLC